MRVLNSTIVVLVSGLISLSTFAGEIVAVKVQQDISKGPLNGDVWKTAKAEKITLMAQPMIAPRPDRTNTDSVSVQSVYNGNLIAFRLQWKDENKNEAGPLGKFSDGVAIQFPVKEGPPPPVFMGAKDMPVHIYHWRAQYQKDIEKGRPDIKDIYPNMNVDAYPMEFADAGNVKGLTQEKRDVYSHGVAAGNPQSFQKRGVDEIYAEGFGSSAVANKSEATSTAEWSKNKWTVVIVRPLKQEGESSLAPGKSSFMAFAVWQGSKDEVGARKSVTMTWTPIKVQAQ